MAGRTFPHSYLLIAAALVALGGCGSDSCNCACNADGVCQDLHPSDLETPDSHNAPDDAEGTSSNPQDAASADAQDHPNPEDLLVPGDDVADARSDQASLTDSSEDGLADSLHDATYDAFDAADVDDLSIADISPDLPTEIPQGTPESPFLIGAYPYVAQHSTSDSSVVQFDSYNCSATTGEKGPELYYTVVVGATGTLRVELLEEGDADVDIHLLSTLDASGTQATGCLARANRLLEVTDLAPGQYTLVLDSYSNSGAVYDGAYRIAVELDLYDQWQIKTLAPGVVWKKKIYSDYCGGKQTVNVLDVDLSQPEVAFRPYWEGECIHPSEVGEATGALAAMNAGFFASGCSSLDFIKIDGEVKVLNHMDGTDRRGFGITQGGLPLFGVVKANMDWTEAFQGISGHPNLVTAGEIDIWPWKDQSLFTDRHPRTALGLTAEGHLLWVTVDGRTTAGTGMTLQELAQHMLYLSAQDAINLDGGGSTTLYLREQSINGIVNSPSDNESPDHWGERYVSDGVLLFYE